MSSRIIRRWYVIIITALVICSIGIPAIWFLTETIFETTAAIKISPIDTDNTIDDFDSESIPPCDLFRITQAEIMTSENILNRVADSLTPKNLDCFTNDDDPVLTLKKMIANDNIKIEPDTKTELIKISMTTVNPDQAEQIINAFLDEYMSYVDSQDTTGQTSTLDILETKTKMLKTKIDSIHKAIESRELKQRNIYDQQQQLDQTLIIYNEITHRIEEIKMQQQRMERISIASRASTLPQKNWKIEMTIATALTSLLTGILFATIPAKKKN